MEKGIVYIAFGDTYVDEAKRSATRVNEVGDWPICLVTGQDLEDISAFDRVIEVDREEVQNLRYGGNIKPRHLTKSPFEFSLYLDTDTYVVDERAIEEIFELLDRNDFAVAHDTHRKLSQEKNLSNDIEDSPEAFSWFNTGVLAFKQSSGTEKLFEKWKSLYHKQTRQLEEDLNDQASFADAVYFTECDYAVLPPEYNHRVPYQSTLNGKVKIVHGHNENLDEIADFVNSYVRRNESVPVFQSLNHEVVGRVAVPVRLSRAYRDEIRILVLKMRYYIPLLSKSIKEEGFRRSFRKIRAFLEI